MDNSALHELSMLYVKLNAKSGDAPERLIQLYKQSKEVIEKHFVDESDERYQELRRNSGW